MKYGEEFAKINESNRKYVLVDIEILNKFMNDIAATCTRCNEKVTVEIGKEFMAKSFSAKCMNCNVKLTATVPSQCALVNLVSMLHFLHNILCGNWLIVLMSIYHNILMNGMYLQRR